MKPIALIIGAVIELSLAASPLWTMQGSRPNTHVLVAPDNRPAYLQLTWQECEAVDPLVVQDLALGVFDAHLPKGFTRQGSVITDGRGQSVGSDGRPLYGAWWVKEYMLGVRSIWLPSDVGLHVRRTAHIVPWWFFERYRRTIEAASKPL
ncbi:MAG TPA: hypothetical protein VG713_08130 [Pirellulales bacterium]|nr:hypothetical protein [Pirellulales bacterium]